MDRRGGFLESAVVHGDFYGTPKPGLMKTVREGMDVLLDIDVQGARQIKRRFPDSVAIFLLPPSKRVLEERLRQRGTDLTDRIEKRLQNAESEIKQIRFYDFVVVNREIDLALEKVLAIISAERQRVSRVKNLRRLSWNSRT